MAEEINGALKNISLAYDGARFSFDNRNYDNNLIVEPTVRYLFINKNALSPKEFGENNAGVKLWYNKTIDENGNYISDDENKLNWVQLDLTKEDLVIWKPESLTFVIKDDIMFMDENNSAIPLSSIFLKVEKTGKTRKIDPETFEVQVGKDGDFIMEEGDHIYSATVQLFSDNHGVGKYITPMTPQSYTFIEDLNNGISYNETQEFSVTMTGFTLEEAETSYWRIEGEDKTYGYQATGSGSGPSSSSAGSASVASDEENIYIGDELVEDGNTVLDGNKAKTASGIEEDDDKLRVDLKLQEDGSIIASAIIGSDKIQVGGNVAITFCMDSATRTAYCFKVKNGQDGVNIVLRSSSGYTLTTGDLSTILNAEIYYGINLMNGDNSERTYYYVWKKDKKALSFFKKAKVVTEEDPNTSIITSRTELEEYKVENG